MIFCVSNSTNNQRIKEQNKIYLFLIYSLFVSLINLHLINTLSSSAYAFHKITKKTCILCVSTAEIFELRYIENKTKR